MTNLSFVLIFKNDFFFHVAPVFLQISGYMPLDIPVFFLRCLRCTPSVPLSLSLGKRDCEGGTVFQRQTQWDGGST